MSRLVAAALFILVAAATAFSPRSTASVRSSSTALNMASEVVKVGDKIPSVILQEGQADYGKPTAVDIAELIAGKKVGEYLCCHVAITVVSNLTLLIIGYLTLKI
jgi:hypothetical protein